MLGYAEGVATLEPVKLSQNEDNVSYRIGLNYSLDSGGLIYGTVSQGYKAGVFSNIAATILPQYIPAGQEKLVAYEAGFKLPLIQNRMQLNAAAFYYDYTDKQTRAKVADVVFGLVEKVVNIPESEVWGLEGELVAQPLDGLVMAAGITYLDSEVTKKFATVDGSPVFNAMGFTGDFKGSELPYTPEISANIDVQYEWVLKNDVRPFVGVTYVYQGGSNATFENGTLRADFFKIPSYETVDVRAGLSSSDGSWTFMIYGRNVFDEYITTAPTFYHDAYFNMTGKPSIYGLSLSLRY